jgi:RimJ/RimL family protein N-acetyltransferase
MNKTVASLPEEVVLEQFVLRRYQKEDAPALAVAVGESLEHLRPWMPWAALEPTTLKDREKLISQWDRDWEEGTQYSFGMFRRERVVGGAGLMARIARGGLEIGYWVHPEFTQRGFATCAAEALTTLGFGLSGVTHIEIHHDKANLISGRVPKKLGFEMVGERAVEAAAPGETGVNSIWRIDRAAWSRGAKAPKGSSGSARSVSVD